MPIPISIPGRKKPSSKPWWTKLHKIHPCASGMRYARGKKSFVAAWDNCRSKDWLVWFMSETKYISGGCHCIVCNPYLYELSNKELRIKYGVKL